MSLVRRDISHLKTANIRPVPVPQTPVAPSKMEQPDANASTKDLKT